MQAEGLPGRNDTAYVMDSSLTDDDVGKPVKSADGETLGTVATVDAATAHVDPKPDMTESIKAVLDWEPSSGDIVPLEDDAIDEVTDDAVRLRAEFSAESVASDEDPELEVDDGRSDGHDDEFEQ